MKKDNINKDKKTLLSIDQFEETHPQIDTEDVLSTYVEYLQEYFGSSKTIAFRWALQEETTNIYDLDDEEDLENIGTYWIDSTHNSHNYDSDVRYMHFFTDLDDKDNILLGVDNEFDHKANLEIFALDPELLEKYEGEGYYDDEADTLNQITEYAIPSNEIKRSDLVDTLPLTDDRLNSHGYDSVTEAYKRVDNMYKDFYDDEEYEL